jgi:uncharacterized protein (DUF362 family)/Pyruvate/2-oxoacid:ferredoxin oxidoreductase delta subunit
MPVPRIAAGSCESYDTRALKEFLSRAFTKIGFAARGSRVLLKPNLLAGKAPRKGVNTHPQIVRSIAEMLLDEGCTLLIGDSPGYESTERALRGSGIMDVVKTLGLEVARFDKKVIRRSLGISPYREFLLGEDPEEFDLIVNLPKFKTHAMMGLTLGVKNAFGFVPRFEKAKWHLKAGQDALLFAAILLDIYAVVKPSLTILDGIVAMEGDGPSSGKTRQVGLLAVSDDALALDVFVEGMLALPHMLPVSRVAQDKGLIRKAEIFDLGVPAIRDLLMPATMDTGFNLPGLVRNALKNVIWRRPKCKQSICKQCGVCAEVCPAGALTMDEEYPAFDYKRCIRCYCCQEMCPASAILLR